MFSLPVVPQDVQDQALPGQEAETEPADSSVDQNEDRQQDQVSFRPVFLMLQVYGYETLFSGVMVSRLRPAALFQLDIVSEVTLKRLGFTNAIKILLYSGNKIHGWMRWMFNIYLCICLKATQQQYGHNIQQTRWSDSF